MFLKTATLPNNDRVEVVYDGMTEPDTNAFNTSSETYYRNEEVMSDDEINEEVTIMDNGRERKMYIHEFVWEFGIDG